MAEVKFFLEYRKDKNGNLRTENVPIMLNFAFGGKRIQYYTGIRIDADKWDDGLDRDNLGNLRSKKRIHEGKARRNVGNAGEINDELAALKTKVTELYNTAIALKTPPTVEYIREGLKEFQMKIAPESKKDVFGYFRKFIEAKQATDAINTIKKYEGTYNHFIGFCGKKRNITFNDVSLTFIEKFRNYLITDAGEKKDKDGNVISRGLTHNTVVKYTKAFKAFLKWAEKRKYNNNPDYKDFTIEGEKEPAIIFLSWPEVMHLYTMEIKSEALQQVRDVFCFGCFTGQRYGDIANLKKHHIINNVWINTPVKSHNAEPLYIPLNDYAQAIINKYDLPGEHCLPVISNQKMNDNLKTLGKLAGLDTPVTVYRFKGAQRIEKTCPKHEVLTTHVMRKTFVSNALSLGMQTDMIKKFTGHKNEKDYNRYLAIINEDKMKAMELFNKQK